MRSPICSARGTAGDVGWNRRILTNLIPWSGPCPITFRTEAIPRGYSGVRESLLEALIKSIVEEEKINLSQIGVAILALVGHEETDIQRFSELRLEHLATAQRCLLSK